MRAHDGGGGRASSAAANPVALIAAIMLATAAALAAMGRRPICACGRMKPWHGSVRSAENSQHLADWYSLSHVVHGLLFYGLGWWLLRRWRWQMRLVLAVAIEAGWEVLENSPAVIARYRAATISWGYSGDSIVNSTADIVCMIVGFLVARRIGWRWSAVLVILLEVTALVAIRDSLVLNIWMLVAPNDAVRMWQAG